MPSLPEPCRETCLAVAQWAAGPQREDWGMERVGGEGPGVSYSIVWGQFMPACIEIAITSNMVGGDISQYQYRFVAHPQE